MFIRLSTYKSADKLIKKGFFLVIVDNEISFDRKLPVIKELVPSEFIRNGMKNGVMNLDLFKVLYRKQLSHLRVAQIISKIIRIGKTTKVCFLFQTRAKIDQRRLIEEWLASEGYRYV